MTTTTTLRDYQWDAVQRLAGLAKDGQRSLSLVTPTGAGKTVILQALIEKLRPIFPAGLVVAPTVAIETGFRDRRVIAYSKSRVAGHTSSFTALVGDLPEVPTAEGKPKPNVKPGVFWHRDTAEGELDQKLSYVLQPDTPPGATFVLTTHMQLALWGSKKLPSDLTNKLLVIDEAHHAGSGDGGEDAYNKLGAFASEWYRRGGTVVYTSATPFRSDGKDVLPTDTEGFTWTLADHASTDPPCAPSQLRLETVVIPNCQAKSQSDFSGDSQIEGADDLACGEMISRWVADGKPKAVFIVPPGQGDQASTWSTNLKARLEDPSLEGGPVRVVNAVGVDAEHKKDFEDALKIERAAKTYQDSQVDVFIACKRFDEGTDWSFCSHVYNWGVPSSFGLILQRWGRAFRLKCADYPEKHKNTATMVFFVIALGDVLLNDYEKTHHDHALLLACYMADWKTGTEYRNALQIKFATARREQRGEPQNETEELERIACEQALVVPDVVRVQAYADIAKLEGEREEAGHTPPTHAEIVKRFEQQGASEETIHAVGVMLAEKLPPAEQAAVAEKVARKMLTGWSAQNPVRPDLRAAFKEVVADYKDLTHRVLDEVTRFYTELTGIDSQNVAKRLAAMRNKPGLTEDMIIEAAKLYLDRTGELPGQASGDATLDFGFPEVWGAVNATLKAGTRGMPGGSSLPKLFALWNLREDKPVLTEELIIAAVDKFYASAGQYPQSSNGNASSAFGFRESWVAVDQCLRKGGRGLLGQSSLAKLLVRHQRKDIKPDLTLAMITSAASSFLKRTGVLPSQRTGDASLDFGFPETWVAVNAALREGMRGLTGQSSLTQLLASCGFVATVPDLSEELITGAAQAHHKRTGDYPNVHSGDASQDFGFTETWGAVNSAMRGKFRGLSDCPDSLAKLLVSRGFKECKPDLSFPTIISAAAKFIDREGRAPSQSSGDATIDFGFPETWNNVYQAVTAGGRGLPNPASLNDILAASGLRANKQQLTESGILEAALNYAERTGGYPKSNSGDASLDFGFSETWASVNSALVCGGRGLTKKGSSITKLLTAAGHLSERPQLTHDIIIAAAKSFFARQGTLPQIESGDATEDFGHPEVWRNIDAALDSGHRGLPSGFSLTKLFVSVGLQGSKPNLSEAVIVAALLKHHARDGKPPSYKSSAAQDFGFPEKWSSVDAALRRGTRGLPGGSSLSHLCNEHGLKASKQGLK